MCVGMFELERSQNFYVPFLCPELTWLQPTDKFRMTKKAVATEYFSIYIYFGI